MAISALVVLLLMAGAVYAVGRQAGYFRRVPKPRMVRTAEGGSCYDYGDHSWYAHAPFINECPPGVTEARR